MKKAFLYCISGVLVISITGNFIQYVANQNRVEELNTALVTSQSQLEAVTNELAELKPKLVQLEHDFSLLYTDYSKLELELSNPEQPEVTEPVEEKPAESNSTSNQQGSSSQQSGGGNQNSSQSTQPSGGGSSSSSKPSGGTSTKPQPAPSQQEQQQQATNDEGFHKTTEEEREMQRSAGFDGNGTVTDWSLWE